MIVGFVGAIQLNVHAKALAPWTGSDSPSSTPCSAGSRSPPWWTGSSSVKLPFLQSWMILSLAMFTTGMVFTMFNALMGRWAMISPWGLMVLLGNPSSGGAVSWPLLPSGLRLHRPLAPPGASVNAQHAAVYYHGHQQGLPVLGARRMVAGLLHRVPDVWRHQYAEDRDHMPQHAAAVT